ncbi:1072_t:CDS:2 [Acaulospora morrowiae]|uniref:Sugar phosphate phosphatase n=1 Tax=Acaulospora morrowiae TaxID=94023 RepID=A0A9N9BIA9_9GLOM|nr:1072_t:CDS:2 [Acaulospora morrowiae]
MAVNPANPPRPALLSTDEKSFAYTTAKYRWPEIITKIIKHFHQACNSLNPSEVDKIQEGKEIANSLEILKSQIQENKPLIPIEDNEADIETWIFVLNTCFKDKTWYTATWLFTECYLYRRVHSILVKTKHWNNHDPYFHQKEEVFRSSSKTIIEIAKRIDELIFPPNEKGNDDFDSNRLIFHELAQVSLWGNATDLSMLPHLNHDDIKRLQGTGAKYLEEFEKNILANDLDEAWTWISKFRNVRIDFVLDNAGFELYGDLVFADWLIQSGYAREIHFHAKSIPWFVSDTTPQDFNWIIKTLQDEAFFAASESERSFLKKLTGRWQSYVANSQWILTSDYFWTSPYAYWHFEEKAPELYANLCKSQLVIFKGDLNYRKLVYDCKWKTTTPFRDAIGPLANAKGAPPVLALRTSKSDVVVGLDKGVEERLNPIEEDWMYSGKYAVIQFSEGNK